MAKEMDSNYRQLAHCEQLSSRCDLFFIPLKKDTDLGLEATLLNCEVMNI